MPTEAIGKALREGGTQLAQSAVFPDKQAAAVVRVSPRVEWTTLRRVRQQG